ncbi:cell division control protein Cdc6, partial [Haloferax sp. Atlit-10N]
MWAAEDPIFERKQLLEIDHIPNEDRIIGRDEEIENIASSLHPAISGGSPRNTLIYGKTGTGKSLVTKHVTRSAQRYAGNQGVEMGRAYVDCTQSSTETRVVVNLARELNNPEETGISIPETGLSTDAYYHRLWQILDELYDVAIVI